MTPESTSPDRALDELSVRQWIEEVASDCAGGSKAKIATMLFSAWNGGVMRAAQLVREVHPEMDPVSRKVEGLLSLSCRFHAPPKF